MLDNGAAMALNRGIHDQNFIVKHCFIWCYVEMNLYKKRIFKSLLQIRPQTGETFATFVFGQHIFKNKKIIFEILFSFFLFKHTPTHRLIE